jgi:hypothetical protein
MRTPALRTMTVSIMGDLPEQRNVIVALIDDDAASNRSRRNYGSATPRAEKMRRQT